MLICSFKGWKNFLLDEAILDELEDFFKSGLIQPVTSFGQYVLRMSEPSKYNTKIAKYFGTDLAKSLTTIDTIDKIRSRESLIILLIEYVKHRTGSIIMSPGFGTYVYLYDKVSQKIIHTLVNYRLEDYQQRLDMNGCSQYMSKFDNILVVMVKNYKKEHTIEDDTELLKSIPR
jgi:hypothetical protein